MSNTVTRNGGSVGIAFNPNVARKPAAPAVTLADLTGLDNHAPAKTRKSKDFDIDIMRTYHDDKSGKVLTRQQLQSRIANTLHGLTKGTRVRITVTKSGKPLTLTVRKFYSVKSDAGAAGMNIAFHVSQPDGTTVVWDSATTGWPLLVANITRIQSVD